MDWIPTLLKHFALSKSGVLAAFVASAVLYAGPRMAPAFVDPVPKEWAAVLVAVLVFSGVVLTTWVTSSAWVLVKRRWIATGALLASHALDKEEMEFLLAVGRNPSEPFNLDYLEYERLQLSRLEVLELAHGLKRKGLVSISPISAEMVFLTATGRQRTLVIERQTAKNRN